MMTHPLTDEILDNISPLPPLKNLYEGERCFATRAARWGADWQLKQVIEWLNNNLSQSNYLEPLWPYGHKIDVDGVLCDLKEAMRPQQQEDN